METSRIALVFALMSVVLSAEIKGIQEVKQEKAKELAATSKEVKKEEHEVDSNALDAGAKKETSKEVKTEINEGVKTIEKGKEDNKIRLEIPVDEKDYDLVSVLV